LDHMQITPAPHHSFFRGWKLFLIPNRQCQSTEGIWLNWMQKYADWLYNVNVTEHKPMTLPANCLPTQL